MDQLKQKVTKDTRKKKLQTTNFIGMMNYLYRYLYFLIRFFEHTLSMPTAIENENERKKKKGTKHILAKTPYQEKFVVFSFSLFLVKGVVPHLNGTVMMTKNLFEL